MKKVLLFISITLFVAVFIACKKEETNKSSIAKSDGTLRGKLKFIEWTVNYDGNEPQIEKEGYVTDEVDEINVFLYKPSIGENEILKTVPVSNGEFSFKLPTPSAEHMFNIAERMYELTVSDASARITEDVQLICYKDGEAIEYYPVSISKDSFNISFVYVDRDVSLKGTYIPAWIIPATTHYYDVNLRKGWNIMMKTLDPNNNKLTYKVINEVSDITCLIIKLIFPSHLNSKESRKM